MLFTSFYSAPSVPAVTPKNVSVFRSDVDRTVIIVTWIPLTLVEAKGFIRYVITLAGSSLVKRQTPLTMIVSGNNATFQGLDPTTDYEVSVGTVNSNGEAGPLYTSSKYLVVLWQHHVSISQSV